MSIKKITIALVSALTVAACSPQVTTSDGRPFIPSGGSAGGGSIEGYLKHVDALNAAGTPVEFRESVISASTFYLAANDVCTEPETIFEFHGPSGRGATVFMVLTALPSPDDFLSDERHAEITGIMAGYYNDAFPGLGNWFLDSGAADKHGLATSRLRGQMMHDGFGVPLCEEV